MNLSRFERETIILFNEQEPTARVETFNARLLKQLDRAEKVSEAVICEKRENGYGFYILPKALVKIHVPRLISEDRKKEMANRLHVKEKP